MLLTSFLLFAAPAATLDRTSVPATGEHAVQLTTTEHGRYALSAESPQGSGLQVIDRMAGRIGQDGRAGEENGRVDLFLDRGETRLLVQSSSAGTGTAKVGAVQFAELNPQPRRLIPERQIETTLGDVQSRSWWVHIPERQEVSISAVARHLGELSFWRDGSWLVDAPNRCRTLETLPGQPLKQCALTATLEPGMYLLTAYGAPSLPWAQESSDRPLYVQWGLPSVGGTGRTSRVIGPYGVDQVRVSEEPSLFRLQVNAVLPVTLGVRQFRNQNQYDLVVEETLTDESRFPVLVTQDSTRSERVVTVTGPPGTPYSLEQYRPGASRQSTPGEYYVTTLTGGHDEDKLDPTFLALSQEQGSETVTVVSESVLRMGKDLVWTDTFNLTTETTLLFRARDAGKHRFSITDVADVDIRVERIFLTKPSRDYQRPRFRRGLQEVDLGKGLFLLTLKPNTEQGIATLTIEGPGTPTKRASSPRGALQKVRLSVPVDGHVRVLAGGDGDHGVVWRPHTLNPQHPIPFTLRPGEVLPLPVTLPTRGILTARSETGAPIQMQIDEVFDSVHAVGPSSFKVPLFNPTRETQRGSLSFVPHAVLSDTPLPPLTQAQTQLIPDFPVLTEASSSWTTLDKAEMATYAIVVPDAGLYRVESSGLLSTSGTLRSRTQLGERKSENGTGRNFRVETYLREGAYQVSVATNGASEGPLGLHLAHTPIAFGGMLTPDIPARLSVEANEAAFWPFDITQAGTYRLQSFGLQQSFSCRLEDRDGWPLDAPVSDCDIQVDLEPGRYHLLGLPLDVESRRISILRRVSDATPERSGHGPHPLAIDSTPSHTWFESDERTPDRWTFSLPASAEVTLRLTPEMRGTLRDSAGTSFGLLATGKALTQRLDAGEYEVSVQASRTNNAVPYRISLSSVPLLEGVTRRVDATSSLPLSVGRTQLVTLTSFGRSDIKARLYDSAGALVAANDDRTDDWNMRIAARLKPGDYRLSLVRLGGERHTEITFHQTVEETGLELSPGTSRSITPGRSVHIVPLVLSRTPSLILARARSKETVGLAIEAQIDGTWKVIGEGEGREAIVAVRGMPSEVATAWRMRVYSLDLRGNPTEIEVWEREPSRIASDGKPTTHVFRTRASGPPLDAVVVGRSGGLFTVRGGGEDLFVCTSPGAACMPTARTRIGASDGLWLLHKGGRTLIKETRVGPDEVAISVSESPIIADLDVRGDATVVIATATGGQPVISQMARSRQSPGTVSSALADRAALSVQLGAGARALSVWSADSTRIDARVSAHAFSQMPKSAPVDGRIDGAVPAGGSVEIPWTRARNDLSLALEAGLVAAVELDGSEPLVLWDPQNAVNASIPEAGARMVLLNPTGRDKLYTATALIADADPLWVSEGTLEYHALARGRRYVTLPEGGETLTASGAVSTLVFLRADGQVFRGTELPIGPGGRLWIHHEPGTMQLTIDGGSWPTTARPERITLSGPGRVPLSGTAMALEMRLAQPSLVHLRSSGSLVAQQLGAASIQVHHTGTEGLSFWLPSGTDTLSLRGLNGDPLTGDLTVTTTAPTFLEEGLGPAVLLAPGNTRLFAFEVAERTPIGVGVQDGADRVELTLYGPNGEVNGRGKAQLVQAEPGTYLLTLTLPSDASPARTRPAVVGLSPPDSGPPDDIVRTYLEAAGIRGDWQ